MYRGRYISLLVPCVLCLSIQSVCLSFVSRLVSSVHSTELSFPPSTELFSSQLAILEAASRNLPLS